MPATHESIAPGERSSADAARPLRAIALVLLSVGSGWSTARLLERGPDWARYADESKLAWLAEHREEPDMLVLGSSLVYRHVDPRVLDAALRARGIESTTFNLGQPGLALAELWWMLDQIEAIDPPRLKRVLISPPKTRVDLKNNWRTRRSVRWHEPGPTLWALRLLLDEPLPFAEKLDLGLQHLADFARNRGGVGIGWEELREALTGTAAERALEREERARSAEILIGPHGDGFRSFGLDWFQAEMDPLERTLLGQRRYDWEHGVRELYERELAERLAQGAPDVPPTPASADFLEAMCARLRARGLEPILMTQPLIVGDDPLAQYAHLWRPEEDAPILIDLSDPARDPELFSSGIHFDRQHLNHRGARRMSEVLAERLAAALAERPR